MTVAAQYYRSYHGPACPRCGRLLNHAAMNDGNYVCPQCRREFEVRVFHPPIRNTAVLQLEQQGPGEATPCAFHARNAAVAACERCGVFICSLCQMTTDAGRFCPQCFDRQALDPTGATMTRIRDYGSLAAISAAVGIFMAGFLGIPGGIMAWYFAIRAWRNPDQSSAGQGRLIFIMFLGLVAFGVGAFFLVVMFMAFTGKKL